MPTKSESRVWTRVALCTTTGSRAASYQSSVTLRALQRAKNAKEAEAAQPWDLSVLKLFLVSLTLSEVTLHCSGSKAFSDNAERFSLSCAMIWI